MHIKFKTLFFGKLILLSAVVLSLNTCKMSYSFSGASIPIEAKTVSIDYIMNNSSTVVIPQLSQTLTDGLKNKLSAQTSLKLVKKDGDLALSGEITGTTTSPAAVGATVAQQNKLEVTVKISFVNKIDPTKNFTDVVFSWYATYPANVDYSAVASTLLPQITDKIVDDIFNKAVVNW